MRALNQSPSGGQVLLVGAEFSTLFKVRQCKVLENPVYLRGHIRGRGERVLETLRDTHSTSTHGEKGPLAIVVGKYAGMRPFAVLCC